MDRMLRWWASGLVVIAVFGVATWVSGAFLLPLVIKSAADRWVLAAGLGVAMAALAALWGQSWATDDSPAEPGDAKSANRSVTTGGNITGIVSTGDDTNNTQYK